MKRLVSALCLLVVLLPAGCAKKKVPEFPIPADRPLYGFTSQGVFFIHESLVKNAKGDTPKLMSQVSEWKPRQMELKGDYYVYDCRTQPKDQKMFEFYREFPIEYYFETGYRKIIPNELLQYKEWYLSEDLRIRDRTGYSFLTEPVENTHLQP